MAAGVTQLRAERTPTPEFPIPPRDATPEQIKWYREFQAIFERYVLNAQLPPHTKGVAQFLRHDATLAKLTWQAIATPILSGKIGMDSTVLESTVFTTLVKAGTIILLTVQDAAADSVRAWVKTRIVGRNFTIKADGLTVARTIGYALFENPVTTLAGSDGTCPLVKTGVVNGSGAFANGTTIVFTWDATVARWTTGTAWVLYDNGTQWYIDTPAVDKFALADSTACPPNGAYPQVGGGLVGATITLS